MRAAQRTIDFVKQWVNGTFTKSQYQNYYIVKTPDAQFLLKQTEQRDLLAIRDNSGHIYMFDNSLYVMQTRYDGTDYHIAENDAIANPLLCLIQEEFPFNYTRIMPKLRAEALTTISKWKVFDRVEVYNPSLPVPIYLSVVGIGDAKYYIYPEMPNRAYNSDSTKQTTPLLDWAQNTEEANYKFQHKWFEYNISPLYSDSITKVNDIKNIYLEIAGENAQHAVIDAQEWIHIPTPFKTSEEVFKQNIKSIRSTRPNPYAFGIVGDSKIGFTQLMLRWQTTSESVSALASCFGIRSEFDDSNWQEGLRDLFALETANNIIAFVEADDLWLADNSEIAYSDYLESRFRYRIQLKLTATQVCVVKDPNDPFFNGNSIYIKPNTSNQFRRLVPSPSIAKQVRSVFNDNN